MEALLVVNPNDRLDTLKAVAFPHGGVHKWGGTPIAGWFLHGKTIGKFPWKIDDLGGSPILGHPHMGMDRYIVSSSRLENAGCLGVAAVKNSIVDVLIDAVFKWVSWHILTR